MFATMFAAILLANSSVDVILENQLDSPEGRTYFLTERLTPYVARADELNREIVALSEEVTRKMGELNAMLPTLDMALKVDTDFQEIDAILNAQALTAEQEKIADRIAQICKNIENAVR
ncbi:MAG: hypothetical protein K1X28_05175 [Parachlamydiales bacterium]|nr:hypothetical protein [Parachlamydiales bacterium]